MGNFWNDGTFQENRNLHASTQRKTAWGLRRERRPILVEMPKVFSVLKQPSPIKPDLKTLLPDEGR